MSNLPEDLEELWIKVAPEMNYAVWLESNFKALYEALEGVLKFVNICEHTNTHRGGAIWTICDDCGEQFADDEGGVPEYKEPPELTVALAALASAQGK